MPVIVLRLVAFNARILTHIVVHGLVGLLLGKIQLFYQIYRVEQQYYK